MRARILQLLESLRTSLWFVPTFMMSAATALAFGLPRFDRDYVDTDGLLGPWVYGGGPEGARQVLSTIAGSMITVAGVVFSVTIVALSLASQQFGPRMLRNFMTDRGTQVVLGTFTSLFLYCILVARTIRSGDESARVPHLSITVAVLLAAIALLVLVYFIHHVSRSIQADSIISRVGRELDAAIDQAHAEAGESARGDEPLPDRGWVPVEARATGYVQAIDSWQIVREAFARGAVVRFRRAPGEFVFDRASLADATPVEAVGDGEWIRAAVAVGPIRTPTQDLEFSVSRLVEMALRALSPSLNDPFTADACIDRLASGFARAAEGDLPTGRFTDGEGTLRLVVPLTSLERIADASFHPIRQASARLPAVALHLLSRLAQVIRATSSEPGRQLLLRHAVLVRRSLESSGLDPADLEAIDGRFRDVLEAMAAEPESPPGEPLSERIMNSGS